MSVLVAYDAAGAPLPGLEPEWLTLLDASDGSAITPPVTPFAALGGGLYRPNSLTPAACGLVDFGASAVPRRVFVGAESYPVFAAFAADGLPLALAAPEWLTVVDILTGDALDAPGITELGGGIYRLDSLPDGAVGVLDLGVSAVPRYLTVTDGVVRAADDVPDVTPPTIANVSPAAGAELTRNSALSLDVTDDRGLRLVALTVLFPATGQHEVAFDGASFTSPYSGSTRTAIEGGHTYVLRRRDGWRSAPSIVPYVIDQGGNEAA